MLNRNSAKIDKKRWFWLNYLNNESSVVFHRVLADWAGDDGGEL